jgi:hypothetical protein
MNDIKEYLFVKGIVSNCMARDKKRMEREKLVISVSHTHFGRDMIRVAYLQRDFLLVNISNHGRKLKILRM